MRVLRGMLKELKKEYKRKYSFDNNIQLKNILLISQIARVRLKVQRWELLRNNLKEWEGSKVWPNWKWEKEQINLRD